MSPVRIRRRWSRRLSPRARTVLAGVGIRILLAATIVGGLYLAFCRMHSDLKNLPRYRVKLANVRLQVPSWVTPTILAQLKEIPDFPEAFSILEPDVAKKLAQAYANNPWVKRVLTVEKKYPQGIGISLEVRRPVAAVRFKGSFYLADAEGARLPLSFRSWPQQDLRLPFVADALSPPPAPGELWEDPGAKAGLAVASLLFEADQKVRSSITTIDVANIGGLRSPRESEIVLLTENRVPVYWGRSPLGNYPRELSVARKLSNLNLAFRQTNGLRQTSLHYVDIRFPNIYVGRHPPGEASGASALVRGPS